jgi:hypothetical protein
MLKQMGHISDRTLDNLLDGTIDDAAELAIEEHVRHCDRCAHRLREWELLFPQVKSLIPTGEHPIPTSHIAAPPAAAIAVPRGHSVYVPDWTPPPSHHAARTRLAWGLVFILGVGAAYLGYQRLTRGDDPTIAYQSEIYEASPPAAVTESAGLGSGVVTPDAPSADVIVSAQLQADSILARARAQAALEAGITKPEEPPTQASPAEPPPRENTEQDVRTPSPTREAPVTFPIRAEPRPAADSPARSETLPPLPAQFQRVTLGEAISRLAGTVRLIQGLNPEAVEVAQGSALPGADPDKAVVRVVYNAPEGRLIMDQQRLGRSGGREPSIAISTAPNGVSVAQWVDRGGFWISLAGRADQQTLLAIANRIR